MISFDSFFEHANSAYLETIAPELKERSEAVLSSNRFGDKEKWLSALQSIPQFQQHTLNLNSPAVSCTGIFVRENFGDEELETTLKQLMPWRKGPYAINDTYIDTEWRSDHKWDRIENALGSLEDKLILDVGCGNGYHLFRMLAQKPRLALGIDPMLFYVFQFFTLNHFFQQQNATVLPLPLEKFPEQSALFDVVFSMGVLYHRRSPIDHINGLKACLKPGGTLLLETLVIEEQFGNCLMPGDRYAKMRNVWFLPSVPFLITWLERLGFVDISLVEESYTAMDEQRSTDWMQFESLPDFLDPDNALKTIEGYPAPRRAALIARKKK